MITTFNHIGIMVKDIRQTVAFYQENFGAIFVRGMYMPGGHTIGAYMQIGSQMLEFLCPLSPDGDTKYGIAHIAFLTDDIEAEAAYLSSRGYDFTVKPKTAGSGGGKLAFFRDPNGANIELLERKECFLQAWSPTDEVRGFDHASVYAEKLQEAIFFYLSEMNFKMLHHIPVPARKFSMVYMNHGNNILELLNNEGPHEGPLMGHIALLVNDTKRFAEKLSAKGAKITMQPRPLATNNGLVCNVEDPNGFNVELIDRVSLFDMKNYTL
jgi:catechol 2,3-dioxygenase-like lactoylglutathione lyase family enzyme